jgi:hypothetical protein
MFHPNYPIQPPNMAPGGYHMPPPGYPSTFALPPPPIAAAPRMMTPQQQQSASQIKHHDSQMPSGMGLHQQQAPPGLVPPPYHHQPHHHQLSHMPNQNNFQYGHIPVHAGIINQQQQQQQHPQLNSNMYNQNVPYYGNPINPNMGMSNLSHNNGININNNNNNNNSIHKGGVDEYVENFHVNNDDAYDLDDNNDVLNEYEATTAGALRHNKRQHESHYNNNNRNKSVANKSRPRYSPTEYDDNYDLEFDMDIIEVEDVRLKKKSKKAKKEKSSSKHHHHHHHRRHSQREEEGEEDEEQLESIKSIIKNVIEMHLNTFEADQNDDPTGTMLQMILQQINDDDGSLSLEDYYGIHEKIKSLLENNAEESEYSNSNKRRDKKKKRKSDSFNEQDDNDDDEDSNEDQLKSSKKKRRNVNSQYLNEYSTVSSRSGGPDKKKKQRHYDDEEEDEGEVEAGEIDDVCEDVAREYEELVA